MYKNYDEEIKQAKEEILDERRKAFFKEHKRFPKDEEIQPKGWFSTQWGTGFIVIDIEALGNLLKAKRNKIYKLGGLL